MNPFRTSKTLQNAQKQATRSERHAFKADLRALKGNASYDDLERYADSHKNARKIVRNEPAYA